MSAVARRERARSRSVRVGLATLLGAAAVSGFALTAQNGMPDYVPGVSRTEVEARFADVGALREGDDVRIAGVRSGFVDRIRLDDGAPVAVLKLDDGREVYGDASASIGARSALGQKYVELDPGTEKTGALSGPIPTERTSGSVELDAVLDTLDATTRTATGVALREIGGGMTGRGQDLRDGLADLDTNLADLGTISKALATDDGAALTDLLRTADVVSGALSSQQEQLAGLTRNTGITIDALAVDEGDRLEETIQRSPDTLRELRGALESLDGPLVDTEVAARALLPGARALGAALPDTRGLLRDAVDPLKKVPGVADDADQAVVALTPLLADARPTVQGLGTALTRLEGPLSTMAPYSREVLLFFQNAASALSQRDAAGGWLRFYPVVNAENVIGNLPIRNPLLQRQPYPAPEEAPTHRTNRIEVVR
jgi:phospholipid/cholesterol/gamma-HCH transport system substrate-binding protein